jgi:hypothetical protein
MVLPFMINESIKLSFLLFLSAYPYHIKALQREITQNNNNNYSREIKNNNKINKMMMMNR